MQTKTEIYFGKRINEITQNDLQSFIKQEVKERFNLEYKEFSDELWNNAFDKVLKDICAFANTLGGLLILGISEKDHRPSEIKGSKLDKTKEDLARKIQANIVYQIPGIQVESIECDVDKERQRVFIIEVPQSSNPPHQVNYKEGIKRYYIRMEHESKEADHCWVEALFQKRLKPELSIDLVLNSYRYPDTYKKHSRDVAKYDAVMTITNMGHISAYDIFLILKFFNGVILTSEDKNITIDNKAEPKLLHNENFPFHTHPLMKARAILFECDAYVDKPFYFLITIVSKDAKPMHFLFKIPELKPDNVKFSYERYNIFPEMFIEKTAEFDKDYNTPLIDILLSATENEPPSRIYDYDGFGIKYRY